MAHRDQIGHEADEVDPLEPEAAGQAPARERGGDRRQHLGEEDGAVLSAGKAVAPDLVKMLLAAGNVTRTMPWTSPAAQTAQLSARSLTPFRRGLGVRPDAR